MRSATLRSGSLWTVQVALAALFLFSSVMKMVMPAEALVGTTSVPAAFYRFIGICEALGALGLILPGVFRIRRDLTPIAAGALAIIMSGAVGMTLQGFGPSAAILPGVTGLLCALVAYGRRDWIAAAPVAPVRSRIARAAIAA